MAVNLVFPTITIFCKSVFNVLKEVHSLKSPNMGPAVYFICECIHSAQPTDAPNRGVVLFLYHGYSRGGQVFICTFPSINGCLFSRVFTCRQRKQTAYFYTTVTFEGVYQLEKKMWYDCLKERHLTEGPSVMDTNIHIKRNFVHCRSCEKDFFKRRAFYYL